MVSLIEKSLLKLLLVITLMIQPVALSYAMASMGHLHQQDLSSIDHQTMMDMGEMSTIQHAASDTATSDTISVDCCDNAACSPAIMSVIEMKCSVPNRIFTLYYPASWEVVNHPAEIRPPRL